MAVLFSVRFFRLPCRFRQIKSLSSVIFPLSWIILLLCCLLVLLFNFKRFDSPHLRLDALYRTKSMQSLLQVLGFRPDPILFPQAYHQDEDLPIFVMALRSDELHNFHRFLGSYRIHFPQKKLVVYNLNLDPDEVTMIRRTCQCLVREVQWNDYPPHVKQLSLLAYIPLLIQETLQEFGLVFWCDVTMRFQSSSIQSFRRKAETLGVVAWPSQRFPTSAYTHASTFRYLQANSSAYRYQHMVEPDSAIFCNTYRLHHKLMLPWVVCSLDLDCIAPEGVKSADICNTQQRPHYLYTGCSRYTVSAFNVLLGLMFSDDSDYTSNVPQLFIRENYRPKISVVKRLKSNHQADVDVEISRNQTSSTRRT